MKEKKVLIINGSPHKDGDTAYILNEIKKNIDADIEQIDAYFDNIRPCIDCRYCWKNEGCSIEDKMDIIYNDNYDTIIIATPIYMSNVTPPLFSIITRMNMLWCNKYFLNKAHNFKKKNGILVLTGGGNGGPEGAIEMAKKMFKYVNAEFDIDTDCIYSLKTNDISAKDDENLKEIIENVFKKDIKK